MSLTMLKKLKTDESAEKAGDRLGGGFEPVPSNDYLATITMMFPGAAPSGAANVTVIAELENGKELRETIYISNKNGETFYVDKQTKAKHELPGFAIIDHICLLTTGEGILEQNSEKKYAKVYDPEQKKEVPTEVDALVDVIGQKVRLGVLRRIEDQQKRGDSGDYETVYDDAGNPKTRMINVIDKVFHPETNRTVAEYRQEIEEPEFHKMWVEKNRDKDQNRASKAGSGSGAGKSGSGRPGGSSEGGATVKKKLFGK